ncbi:unnamed protein product [Phyllotreta striolata]|uniref:FAD dependent oxidoreductase domain-containing protein n=1 Tax=Phyllotreta striolata TaxID=444603 RepID=A0A9N9XQV2_PHYSR|nr:unnamed protein product [Phyllotreta striolata]
MHQIAVLGCGIIGMTTAMRLQERFPGLKITIITKETSPNTTSDIAAGYWAPFSLQNTPEGKILRWSSVTYQQLLKWWKEGRAAELGICLLPGSYYTEEKNFQIPSWLETTLGYEKLPAKCLEHLSRKYGLKLTNGYTFTSFTWESSIALPRLQKQFIKNGGTIVKREVKSLKELDQFDAIINCTGWGAKVLVGDDKMIPIRGQVEKIEAPWQFHVKIVDSPRKLGYVIPNTRHCVLGGTAIVTDDTSVNEEQKLNIRKNCAEIAPSLSNARTKRYLVGLRPGREEVRLQVQTNVNNKPPIIIHNYGHGGAGITLSIGCADEVAELVKDLLGLPASKL